MVNLSNSFKHEIPFTIGVEEEYMLCDPDNGDLIDKANEVFESLDDLIIIESSSIELDDIIRLEDDSGRENGRIENEHS